MYSLPNKKLQPGWKYLLTRVLTSEEMGGILSRFRRKFASAKSAITEAPLTNQERLEATEKKIAAKGQLSNQGPTKSRIEDDALIKEQGVHILQNANDIGMVSMVDMIGHVNADAPMPLLASQNEFLKRSFCQLLHECASARRENGNVEKKIEGLKRKVDNWKQSVKVSSRKLENVRAKYFRQLLTKAWNGIMLLKI